jgi:hypothetical protein
MRRILAFVAAAVWTMSAHGQLTLGPRYSNYSTVTDIEILTIETGRQHAFGMVGEYRSGAFVLDFQYDHDPENGFQIIDILPLDVDTFTRDRGEVTIGWAPHPYFDLQGGVRFDQISIGGGALGGDLFFGGRDFDHTGIVVGVKVHTPSDRPFGLYGIARGFLGYAELGDSAFGRQEDVTGRRLEGGIVIPIGESAWKAVPGIEYEYLELGERVLAMETNRFFVNFVYTFR